MKAFADILIEFDPQDGVTPPSRCAGFVREECRQPGWLLRAEALPGQPRVLACASIAGCTGWVIGEIYRYGERTGTSGELLGAFLANWLAGRPQPGALAGRFAIAAWSAREQKWSVWTDRTGGIHVYHTPGRDGAALGTYSPAVYSFSRRSLDWTGLAGFAGLGFFPEDRTHYQDVRVLRPASRYDFAANGALERRETYWHWAHHPSGRGEDETIAEFDALMRRVVAEQTHSGRVALPLSGGLDSRTLAACLPGGSSVVTYSYGYSSRSVEPHIAGQVALARSLDFTPHTVGPYLFDQLDNVIDAVEGFQDVTQARQACVAGWLGERADYVLGAHWGDVLCDDMGVHTTDPAAASAHAFKKMSKRGGEWLLEHLCRPHLNGADPEQVARQALDAEFSTFDGIEDMDFRVKALKTSQWAFRWTLASLRMYQTEALPRLPFLDPRILDFFTTVPATMVRARRLQIEYLKRFAPELARVRWQAYDADLFHYDQFNTWQLPRRAWRKIQRALNPQLRVRRNWEVQFFSPGQWPKLEDYLTQKGLLLHDLLPATRIRTLIEEFRHSPDASRGYTVSMLLTLSAWLERVHRG